MIGDTWEKRVERLENTCRNLEARIDGHLAALAFMPGATELPHDRAGEVIKLITGVNIVTGDHQKISSKDDMVDCAKAVVAQAKGLSKGR